MQNIKHLSAGTPHNIREILHRTSLPFFLFSSVLAFLLFLSWLLLLPGLTHIEVAGKQRSLQELLRYQTDLTGQITTLEAKRDDFLTPVQDDVYQRLLDMKEDRFRFQDVRREVTRTAQTLLPDVPDAIAFRSFLFDAEGQIAEIRGEVRNVGPRSMTVLAQFADALGRISFVQEVRSSRFTREDHGDGEFASPFTIRLILHLP